MEAAAGCEARPAAGLGADPAVRVGASACARPERARSQFISAVVQAASVDWYRPTEASGVREPLASLWPQLRERGPRTEGLAEHLETVIETPGESSVEWFYHAAETAMEAAFLAGAPGLDRSAAGHSLRILRERGWLAPMRARGAWQTRIWHPCRTSRFEELLARLRTHPDTPAVIADTALCVGHNRSGRRGLRPLRRRVGVVQRRRRPHQRNPAEGDRAAPKLGMSVDELIEVCGLPRLHGTLAMDATAAAAAKAALVELDRPATLHELADITGHRYGTINSALARVGSVQRISRGARAQRGILAVCDPEEPSR